MKNTCKNQLPALIVVFVLLILWQMGAMHMNAAYILPSPTQILQKLWELRVPADYPRTRACLRDPRMIELREQLIDLLRKRGVQ